MSPIHNISTNIYSIQIRDKLPELLYNREKPSSHHTIVVNCINCQTLAQNLGHTHQYIMWLIVTSRSLSEALWASDYNCDCAIMEQIISKPLVSPCKMICKRLWCTSPSLSNYVRAFVVGSTQICLRASFSTFMLSYERLWFPSCSLSLYVHATMVGSAQIWCQILVTSFKQSCKWLCLPNCTLKHVERANAVEFVQSCACK